MVNTKNFFILMTIIVLGLVFVLVSEYYFDIDPSYLQACDETEEPCPGDTVSVPPVVEPGPQPDDFVACTMDAKQCPDGSFVGRIAPDCQFAACPSAVVVDSFEDCVAAGNPVMESYPRQCNHNGQGFVEDVSVSVSNFPIRYGEDVLRMEEYRQDCEQRMGVFNECGSACGPEAETCMAVCSMICEGPADEKVPAVPPESTFCTPASRSVGACIEIYQPVCAAVEVQCVTTPCDPVPQTYSNGCFACMDENVISYVDGTCGAELSEL